MVPTPHLQYIQPVAQLERSRCRFGSMVLAIGCTREIVVVYLSYHSKLILLYKVVKKVYIFGRHFPSGSVSFCKTLSIYFNNIVSSIFTKNGIETNNIIFKLQLFGKKDLYLCSVRSTSLSLTPIHFNDQVEKSLVGLIQTRKTLFFFFFFRPFSTQSNYAKVEMMNFSNSNNIVATAHTKLFFCGIDQKWRIEVIVPNITRGNYKQITSLF